MVNYFNTWASHISSSYGVNPWIFIVIYLATFIPAWVLVFMITRGLLKYRKDKSSRVKYYLISLITGELIILALPYLYLFFFMSIFWEAKVLMFILIVIFSYRYLKRELGKINV
jgi:biotin transporter BioY